MSTPTDTGRAEQRVARQSKVRVDEDGLFVPGPSMLVSYKEMEVLFRVAHVTVHQWRQRDVFIDGEPYDTVSGTPLWPLRDVVRWAQQTSRTVFLTPSAWEQLGIQP